VIALQSKIDRGCERQVRSDHTYIATLNPDRRYKNPQDFPKQQRTEQHRREAVYLLAIDAKKPVNTGRDFLLIGGDRWI
jgi:hypothetical protein